MANEEIKQIVMGLRPIDDDFMNIIFNENTPLVEYVLQVILDKSDLIIEESKTQVKTNHFGSRNVTFDVLAKDNTGKRYNIEVQRSSAGADTRRARYHSASIDVDSLSSGQTFKELLDSYVIFITEKDVLNGQEPIYHINRSVAETTEIFDDGAHIIYVNASYQNVQTSLGKLIHDFMCSQSSDMLCEPIAKVTYKYKNTPEGVDYMCKAVEEYGLKREKEGIQKGRREGRQEGIIESVIKFIKKGKLSYEEIADNFDIPVDEVRKLAAQTL
ncbi:conserved hypothetical protein (putative transposase or invertase) [Ruminococcaceae bacterium P7]|nr:conserved hypothetical protein (putative transposase or invertase) [Ruminococcaceae bacterium P7]